MKFDTTANLITEPELPLTDKIFRKNKILDKSQSQQIIQYFLNVRITTDPKDSHINFELK